MSQLLGIIIHAHNGKNRECTCLCKFSQEPDIKFVSFLNPFMFIKFDRKDILHYYRIIIS